MAQPGPDEKNRWLDDPKNVTRVIWGLAVVCVLLFVAEGFYHKHTKLAAESWFGFYAFFGFIGSVVLVVVAKGLRKILMRDEDYYDR